MIRFPYNWAGKLKEGFSLSGHITDIRMHKQQIMPALQYWVVGTVTALVIGFFGVWEQVAAAAQQWVRAVLPKESVVSISITPAAASMQTIVYVAALLGVAATARAILSGRARVVHGLGWYIFRFIIVSVIMVLSLGFGAGLAARTFFAMKGMLASGGGLSQVISFLFVVIGLAIVAFALRFTLCWLTFGAATYLQGKSVQESYRNGVALVDVHWPYLIGIFFYYIFFTGVIRWVLTHVVSPAGSLGIIVGACTYLLWPLYWLLILEYHKGAARSGRTATRTRRSMRSSRTSGTRSRSTRSSSRSDSSSRSSSSRRAPRKK